MATDRLSFLDKYNDSSIATEEPKKKSEDRLSFLDKFKEEKTEDRLSFLDKYKEKPSLKEKTREFLGVETARPYDIPESITNEYANLYPSSIRGNVTGIAKQVGDYFSSLAEPIKPEEQYDIAGVTINPVLKSLYQNIASGKFGEDIVKQIQSGGFAGAPSMTPEIGKRVATDLAVIGAIEAAFVPVMGAAAASVAPRILTSFAHLTQAATTGSALTIAHKLVQEGELPSLDEVVENGLEWMGIDAAMQLLFHGGSVTSEFTQAVRKIAKEDNKTVGAVLGELWSASKNWIKSKMGRTITPDDIRPEDALVLYNKVKETEIDITPKKETLPKTIEHEEPLAIEHKPEVKAEAKPPEAVKPVEKPKRPSDEFVPEKPKIVETPAPKKELDITPAGLEKQKEFILDKIDAAIDKPPKSEKIHIDVPGDGEFNITNTPKALETARDRIEKKWPTKPLPSLQKTYKKPNVRKTDRTTTLEKQNAKLKEEFDKIHAEYEIEWNKEKRNQDKVDELYTKMTQLNKKYKSNFESIKKIKQVKESDILSSKIEQPTAKKKPIKFPRPAASKRKTPVVGKEQAVSRSKIIQLFRDAFRDPIRIGKMGRRARTALGFHKLWPRVTRLLKDNDVETAAHEIGHNLHGVLYGDNATTLRQMNANVHKALRPYMSELKPLGGYEPFDMEGFAEFVRMYVTNPTTAQKLAPSFFAKFEADMDALQPKLKNALLEARDYYDKWLNATPESRIAAHKVSGQQTFMERIWDKATESFNWDKFLTNFSDDLFHAKRLVSEAFDIPIHEVEAFKHKDNIYRSLRLLKSAVNKGEVFLTYETFDPITLDKTGESFKSILDELKTPEELEGFENYLIAKRALEKYTQNIETGVIYNDAVYYVQKYEKSYQALAQRFYAYHDRLMDYAYKCQLLSKESVQSIKAMNKFYAPFLRHKGKVKGFASGAGKLQPKRQFRRMKGGHGDIISPLESSLKLTYEIITNSEKNLVAHTLARIATQKGVGRLVEHVPVPIKLKAKLSGEQVAGDLAKNFEANGLQDLIEYDAKGKAMLREDILDAMPEVFLAFGPGTYKPGENIITYFVKGKPRFLEVTPELYEMWSKGTSPYEANLLIKILRLPARTLRAGAILNPKFMLKNIVRDTWGSYILTRYPSNFVNPVNAFIELLYEPLAGLSHAIKKDQLYVEFLKSGGGMSSLISLDLHSVSMKLADLRDGKGMKSLLHMLRLVGEMTEEANRLAEYARALQVEGSTRLGKEISAYASRDLSIDYAKMGLLVKSLNQIIAFFNATIQGGTKLFRTLQNPKTRQDFVIRCLQMIVLPSIVLAWYNKDDERIDEIPEKERDFNFCFFVGDTLVKIPVPFEPGVISHGLTQRMYAYMIKKDPEAFKGFFGSIAEAMLPSFVPTLEVSLIEIYANRNFFTGGRIIPADKERLISRLQYNRFTSQTARLLGRAVSYMIGQDTTSKAASPAVIDHFIRSYTGGLGSLIVSIADEALEKLGIADPEQKADRTVVEKLGLDAFTGRYPRASSKSIEEFYDLYADFHARLSSIKYERKFGGDEKGHEGLLERTDSLYDVRSLDKAYKAIQRCQKAINAIQRNTEITSEEKRQLTDQLYLDMTAFAKAAVQNIKQHRRDKQ